MNWAAAIAGADVAKDVLGFLGFDLAKAETNPLSREGFDEVVMALVIAMRRGAGGELDALVQAATQRLDRDWGRLSEDQREEAFRRAAAVVVDRIDSLANAATAPMQASAKNIITQSRRASSATNGLSVRDIFSAGDDVAAKFARTSSNFFFRSTGGRILSGAVDTTARRIVGRALREGWDKQETGKAMFEALRGTVGERSRSYFEMVASVSMARARSYSLLRSFEEAGISTFMLRSVLDENTSDICRFMHGRTFEVRQALRRYEEVHAAPVGAVVNMQPFIRLGRYPDGTRVLFAESRGQRFDLAEVRRSAVGQKDQVGNIVATVPDARLASLGCCTPPFHPHCRTTMLAVSSRTISTPTGTRTVPTPTPVAPPPPPRAPLGNLLPAPAPITPRPAPPKPHPTPPGLQIGVHIKSFAATVSRPMQQRFLQDIAIPWVLDILKAAPLDELRLLPKMGVSNKTNGLYMRRQGPGFLQRILGINAGRKAGSWGETLVAGSSWSVSTVAPTKRAAMLRTFIHELGHHIHQFDVPVRGTPPAVAAQVSAIVKRAFGQSKSPLTGYSLDSEYEYFAEAFAAYVFERAALQAHDPIAFKMVEDVLALRGFVVR